MQVNDVEVISQISSKDQDSSRQEVRKQKTSQRNNEKQVFCKQDVEMSRKWAGVVAMATIKGRDMELPQILVLQIMQVDAIRWRQWSRLLLLKKINLRIIDSDISVNLILWHHIGSIRKTKELARLCKHKHWAVY